MKLLNNGVCVKECPKEDSPKVDCKATKEMLAMTKTKNGVAQEEYYENCEFYVNKSSMAKILGPKAEKLAALKDQATGKEY